MANVSPLDKAEAKLKEMWNAASADDFVVSPEGELGPDSPVVEPEVESEVPGQDSAADEVGEDEKDEKVLANLLSKTTKQPIERNGTPVIKGLRECGLALLKEKKTLEKHRRKLETEKRRSEAHEFAMRRHFEREEQASKALTSMADIVEEYPWLDEHQSVVAVHPVPFWWVAQCAKLVVIRGAATLKGYTKLNVPNYCQH